MGLKEGQLSEVRLEDGRLVITERPFPAQEFHGEERAQESFQEA